MEPSLQNTRRVVAGIETSGRAGSVALLIDGQLHSETELSASGRRHARTLVPELKSLLQHAGLAPRDVTCVAVSLGPGSFTGLRVGAVCAKTWAYATGCALVGVETFQAIASVQEPTRPVWVIDDALRGDLFAGRYVFDSEEWRTDVSPGLISLEDWKSRLTADEQVSGPAVAKLAAELQEIQHAPLENCFPTAGQIARLGDRRLLQGTTDDPWTLEPTYIRRSAAEEKADGIAEELKI